MRTALIKSTLKPSVTENGKKWQVLEVPFGEGGPTEIYFDPDTHLIAKTITTLTAFQVTVTETLDDIKIDKPIDPAVFKYTVPDDATQVDKFVAPQRPEDARNGASKIRG